MNANELADLIECACCAYQKEAGAMLRQQQERLTKYELRHAEQRKRIDELEHQQQAEIEALKQIIDANNLNQNIGQFVKVANEPVAYINEEDGLVCAKCYKPFTKELTDEEIAELSDKILCYQIYDNKESGVFEFARAILRKAQEK